MMRVEAFETWFKVNILGSMEEPDFENNPIVCYIKILAENQDARITEIPVARKLTCAVINIPKTMRRNNKMSTMSDSEGKLSIDGGCDTSLIDNGFYIDATTNRTVDVQGLTDNIKVESLPIVSAVTAVDVGYEVVLLELHECIAVEANQIS